MGSLKLIDSVSALPVPVLIHYTGGKRNLTGGGSLAATTVMEWPQGIHAQPDRMPGKARA